MDKPLGMKRIFGIRGLGSLSSFYLLLGSTICLTSTYYILLPVLPLYLGDLGSNNLQIGFVMGIFSISSLVLRPVSGSLADRQGRKALLFISIILFLLTPLLYVLSPSILLVGAVQIIYGFSVGTFAVASTTLAADLAPSEKLTQYLGIFSLAFGASKGFAPAIGNLLFLHYGFNGVLAFSWVLGLISLVFLIPVNETKLPVAKGSGSFGKTLFDFRILMPTVTLLCGMVTFGVISNWLTVFAHRQGIVNVSLFFFINTVFMVLTRLLTGNVPNKSLPKLAVLSGGLMVLSLWCLAGVTELWQLAIIGMIYGIGFGAYYPTLTSIVVLSVSKEERGTALGIYSMAFDLGMSVGSILGGLSHYFSFGYVFWGVTVIPVLGLIYFWQQHRRLEALA